MEISTKMILKSGRGRLREMVIRELKQRRRRRQLGRQKSNRFITQNNNFARASRFFVHFFTVLARLRRENREF